MPAGEGPIGVKSIFRVFKSNRAIPNSAMCTIGSAELNRETYARLANGIE